jgi:hypothetical protein
MEVDLIMKEYGLDIRRVLETDFSKSEVQRDELKYYEPLVQRGSCRLKEGLFRTEAEQREFLKTGDSIRFSKFGNNLPLTISVNKLLSVIRSLFSRNATDRQTPKT